MSTATDRLSHEADLDLLQEDWECERRALMRMIARLEAENVDLKNQLADLRQELSMRSWLS